VTGILNEGRQLLYESIYSGTSTSGGFTHFLAQACF